MNFSLALDQTIRDCGIQVKWLAARAGVSQQMISSFRNGKQRIMNDSLESIIAALPIEARQYFFKQLGILHTGDLLTAIEGMNDEQLARLLNAIASKLQPTKASQELISA
jgi:transcriptional regulator with XRE-family HTH domain